MFIVCELTKLEIQLQAQLQVQLQGPLQAQLQVQLPGPLQGPVTSPVTRPVTARHRPVTRLVTRPVLSRSFIKKFYQGSLYKYTRPVLSRKRSFQAPSCHTMISTQFTEHVKKNKFNQPAFHRGQYH